MSYGGYYRDERTLEEKLVEAEKNLQERRELYRRCVNHPEHKQHWNHYRDEDHCVGNEIRIVNEIKEKIYYRDLPKIDQQIYNAKENIWRAKYNVRQAKDNLDKAERDLQDKEISLIELEKEKLVIELAGIK